MRFRRSLGRIAADEAPKTVLVLGPRHRGEVQQHLERHHEVRLGHLAAVDMPDGVCQLLLGRLAREGAQLLMVFVHGLGDDVEMHPLRRLGLLVHEIGQAFRGRVGQPFVDGKAIALGFRDLLPVLVQEQLIGEMLGRAAAQHLADAVVDRRVGGMVLAIHLEIDVQRRPAGAEVGLPLQLHMAARDRQGPFAARLVVEGDLAAHGVHVLDRHVQDAAGFRVDRQEAGIGLLPLLAQAGQHDLHDRVVTLGRQPQRVVELARLVELGRADELVFEAEGVQEAAQHGVVVVAEAGIFTEGIGHRGQRLLQVLPQHLGVRNVVRDLPHPVQVVGKTEQARGDIADKFEGAADHRGPRDLAEGADMRQARGPVTGLEQDVSLLGILLLVTFQHPTGFLEGPGLGIHRRIAQGGHGCSPSVRHSP